MHIYAPRCCAASPRPSPPPPPTPHHPHAGGITYLFVSNSDNLGATLDLDLLAYFAHSDKGFLMEVRYCTAVLLLSCRCRCYYGCCSDGTVCIANAPPGKQPAVFLPCPAHMHACVLQVCEREQSDKKGGHLARRKADGRLV